MSCAACKPQQQHTHLHPISTAIPSPDLPCIQPHEPPGRFQLLTPLKIRTSVHHCTSISDVQAAAEPSSFQQAARGCTTTAAAFPAGWQGDLQL